MNDIDEKCLTTKELLVYLKTSPPVFYAMIKTDKDFPRFLVGKCWRYDLEEVLDHLKKAESNEGN
ncbi:hypothetical protein COB55_03285 [Candidatus Wolfebacteria bacterium]|nr:MAG: hypothetical protein COB55_03285 [Candidatus Wolfebacteria bacterium]